MFKRFALRSKDLKLSIPPTDKVEANKGSKDSPMSSENEGREERSSSVTVAISSRKSVVPGSVDECTVATRADHRGAESRPKSPTRAPSTSFSGMRESFKQTNSDTSEAVKSDIAVDLRTIVDNNHIICEGSLKKSDSKGTNWRTRWVVLKIREIIYKKSATATAILGSIPIDRDTVVLACTAADVDFKIPSAYLIRVLTKERTYNFAIDTITSAKSWCKSIQYAIDVLLEMDNDTETKELDTVHTGNEFLTGSSKPRLRTNEHPFSLVLRKQPAVLSDDDIAHVESPPSGVISSEETDTAACSPISTEDTGNLSKTNRVSEPAKSSISGDTRSRRFSLDKFRDGMEYDLPTSPMSVSVGSPSPTPHSISIPVYLHEKKEIQYLSIEDEADASPVVDVFIQSHNLSFECRDQLKQAIRQYKDCLHEKMAPIIKQKDKKIASLTRKVDKIREKLIEVVRKNTKTFEMVQTEHMVMCDNVDAAESMVAALQSRVAALENESKQIITSGSGARSSSQQEDELRRRYNECVDANAKLHSLMLKHKETSAAALSLAKRLADKMRHVI